VAEDLLSPDDDLLRPRFYLAPELDGWLEERLRAMSLGVGLFPAPGT
jgi:hypothetical protein